MNTKKCEVGGTENDQTMETTHSTHFLETRDCSTEGRSIGNNPYVKIPQREPYPSDLTDRQWSRVETVIPIDRRLGRKRKTAMREIVNTMNYRWSTGCSWRMLPHDLPPWPTVYTYFRRWLKDGTLKQIRDILLKPANKKKEDDEGTLEETD